MMENENGKTSGSASDGQAEALLKEVENHRELSGSHATQHKSKTIYIAGMTCHSCEKLVAKAVESVGGKVHSIDARAGVATVDCPSGATEKLKSAIADAGYELLDKDRKVYAPEPFERELRIFINKLLDGERELHAERKLLALSFGSMVLLLACGFMFYLFVLRALPDIGARIPFLLYGTLSAVAITASIAHYYSHRRSFTCMEGMMVGMTIGMMAGFLFGAVVGATNGMFAGSVFGMAVGMLTGAYCGKCCGIMGVMEGMMAGLMGGTMGAMLSVMMISDNLLLFMPLFVASCLAILAGLTYMIYSSAGKREDGELMGASGFFALALLLSAATAAVVLYAPRSGIVV